MEAKHKFKIVGLHHLGMVPKDLAQARHFFGTVLGLIESSTENVPEQKVQVNFFDSANDPTRTSRGPSQLELLDPLMPDSPIAKFLAKGGGIHHIALKVDDIDKAISHLKSHHIKMIDEVAKRGAHSTKVAFVHPHATGGFLVELVQDHL